MLPASRGPCFTAKNVDIRSYFQQAIFHFVCLSQILKKLRNDTKTLNSSAIADRSWSPLIDQDG